MEKKSIQEKLKHYFRYFLLSFTAVFFLRLGYGFAMPDNSASAPYSQGSFNTNNESQQNSVDNNLRKNYASEKGKFASPGQPALQNREKYEKIGSLTSQTKDFVNDEKRLRGTITQYKAVIQSEQATGLAGHRVLRLSIGVDPGKFDELVEDARKIGELGDIQITKADKTNEYQNLNAKRVSQEKYRTALKALKGKGGKITELIELENKILEIEKEIQNLGVKLGDFDEQNEFCTVRFALVEGRSIAKTGFFTSLFRRIKVALEWSLKYYLMAALLFVFAGLAILVFIIIAEKLGFVKHIVQRFADEVPEATRRSKKS